jgi:hypothetical protein
VAVGVDERRRVGGGVEVAVEADRVLGRASDGVGLREDAEGGGVEPRAGVVEGIAARADVEPALVAPGVRARARGGDRLTVAVVAVGVGDRLRAVLEADRVTVEVEEEPGGGACAGLDPGPGSGLVDEALGRAGDRVRDLVGGLGQPE